MKFFDRIKERQQLQGALARTQSSGSQLTVVTGRRRIGKTKLILNSFPDEVMVYWFVTRSNEAMLCGEFAQVATEKLGVLIPNEVKNFSKLFELVMQVGRHQSFTLVIDEFQEFFTINAAVFSQIQSIWDQYKDTTKVNLIVSGSVHSLMKRIFQDAHEPLFGRASQIIQLRPFRTDVLKDILQTYNPQYTSEDLLALYAFTGGVPKYIELLMDRGCVTKDQMIECMVEPGSLFLTEGQDSLVMEFGRDYGTYFSIISSIATGFTTQGQITSLLGGASIGGQLKKLEEEYELIQKKRPIFSKPGSQNVQFALKDQFLRFWFRYMYKYRSLIEMDQSQALKTIIERDYTTFTGLALEDYFREKLRETGQYLMVDSWWQMKKGEPQAEVDIVATDLTTKVAFVAEVKRQRSQFREREFLDKVELLKTKELKNWTLSPQPSCLTMDDM